MAHMNQSEPDATVLCSRRVGRDRVDVDQPKAARDYNKHMNGVDTHDQLGQSTPSVDPAKKFWKFIYTFIIDCCRVNA